MGQVLRSLRQEAEGVNARRPKARKDGNHDAIVARFEALGCTVAQLHAAGVPGWPDLVVGVIGQNRLVEIKNPDTRYGRAGLNTNQKAFNRDWRGEPMFTVSSEDEVTVLVMNWRRNARP